MHLVPIPSEIKSVKVQRTTDRGAQKVRVRHGRYSLSLWLAPWERVAVDKRTGIPGISKAGADKLLLAIRQDRELREESARFR